MAETVVGGQAIVIGAGIGGLAAAGAIATSFEQVTVVERDAGRRRRPAGNAASKTHSCAPRRRAAGSRDVVSRLRAGPRSRQRGVAARHRRFPNRDVWLRSVPAARLWCFPRGLIPLGDAICRFNPVWGQGMSVAAQEAVVLRRLLGRGGDPLARLAPEFFAEAGELIETPWAQAAIPDFALPQTTGQRPPDLERRLKFGCAFSRLAAQDPEVHRLVVEVRHLLKPSSALRDLVERVEALMAEA